MPSTSQASPVNQYSPNWFTHVLEAVPTDLTELDVDGIARRLPSDRFRRVLDTACGRGRIALPLVDLGYDVTGVDRSRDQLDIARDQLGERPARFIALDLRDLSLLRGPFDAIVSLWQSFGHFESAINDTILGDMADLLRPDGRLLLDLYHPGYVAAHLGPRSDPCPGVQRITDQIVDGRLRSQIEYLDGTSEIMDLELLDPDDLARRAARVDLQVVEACAWWDASSPPSAEVERYQVMLERP